MVPSPWTVPHSSSSITMPLRSQSAQHWLLQQRDTVDCLALLRPLDCGHHSFVSSASIWQHFNNLILKHMHALTLFWRPLAHHLVAVFETGCLTSADAIAKVLQSLII